MPRICMQISYPCSMLNRLTADMNVNDQYQTLVDKEKKIYKTSKVMLPPGDNENLEEA